MKKKLAYFLIGTMAIMTVACGKEETNTVGIQAEPIEETTSVEETSDEAAEEQVVGMVNPWVESDAAGVLSATGFPIAAPDGASNVVYSYMKDAQLAQVSYDLNGVSWTYRIQSANELTDISGMYYEWSYESEGQVSGRPAMYYSYSDATEDSEFIDSMNSVQLVNWYDVVPGVTYSLSAQGTDLNGMDIQVYAENIFEPLQGEVDGDADVASEAAGAQDMVGLHVRSEDESELDIQEGTDGNLAIHISIIRLCDLENGVGTYDGENISFTVDDPNGNEMKGIIYQDPSEGLCIKFTDSTWDYLPTGEVLTGFDR